MNEYIGKICPYCKTEFQPGDDIVVCSACDMPHHKDCWVENQGCTTFGCMGTIRAADGGASSVTATQMHYEDVRPATASESVFCVRCGNRNSAAASFCTNCGNRLVKAESRQAQAPVYTQANPANTNPYAYTNQPSVQPYSQYPVSGYAQAEPQLENEEVLRKLIGEKPEYYLNRFRKMRQTKNVASWNWSAFLFAPYWFFYRKMYGYGIAVLAADIICSLLNATFLSVLALGGYVLFGIFANSIYMRHLQEKANRASMMGEPERSQFLESNGGVNKLVMALVIVGRAVLVGLLLL